MQVRSVAVKSLLPGCCLACEMNWSVCLNFEPKQLYHCCFYIADCKYYKLNVGIMRKWKYQRVLYKSTDNYSECELSSGSLWWLSEGCDCRPWKRRLLPLNLSERTLSFYPLWGTSVIFRRWSVLLVLLCWPPSNFWALNDVLLYVSSAWRYSISLLHRTKELTVADCICWDSLLYQNTGL